MQALATCLSSSCLAAISTYISFLSCSNLMSLLLSCMYRHYLIPSGNRLTTRLPPAALTSVAPTPSLIKLLICQY